MAVPVAVESRRQTGTNGQMAQWVQMTDGLSFAALAELVISVRCLGNGLEESAAHLRSLDEHSPTSKEFSPNGAQPAAN